MKTSHNIKEIRQLYNLTQQEFAAALGITRELVNKMEKGKTPVSKATSALIQQFVLDRKSENISLTDEEVEFFGIPSTKHSSLPYFLQRREQKNEPSIFMVPLVGIKAQAGYVKGYEHVDYLDTLEKYSLPPGVNPTGAVWRYFEIDGDSMEPTLSPGDLVLATMVPAEDWNDIRNFSVYVIHTNDQLLIKRIYRKSEQEWVLISDNEDAYPQRLLKTDEVRQLWLFRRHIRSRIPQPREFRITA
jgi:phage repressor protein C with HTH and peptisase S24 domain